MKKTRTSAKRWVAPALGAVAICGGQPSAGPEASPRLPAPSELPATAELPDPFAFFGTDRRVESTEDWSERREELKVLFQEYMYGAMPFVGRAPESFPQTTRPIAPPTPILGGKAVLKQVAISFDRLPAGSPEIRLAIVVPTGEPGARRPVFLALNKCGNRSILPEPAIVVDPAAWVHEQCPPGEERGAESDFWCVEYLVDRGYAFATFHESDVDPDKHDFGDGIHAAYERGGAELDANFAARPPETQWGTIAAWAWGLMRAADYLESDPDIDRERICVTGHSRRGKTALLAGAFDERFALVVPHQSGTGGMALSRDNDQETVERINRVFPHWFSDAFVEFGGREAHLPIDQHLLAALVAPRALLETAGLQDKWANFDAALRALRAADPVWKLLGAGGMNGDGVAVGDEPIADIFGEAMQFRLDKPHTLDRDFWRGILDYADLLWKSRAAKAGSGSE